MLSFFKKKKDEAPNKALKAFLSGKVIPIEEVNDPVFSVAPWDGVISTVMLESKHAVGITAANGMELLIHEGVDTVSLNGEGFELFVNEGDNVKAGDKLIKFNAKFIKSKGYPATCILAITNSDEFPNMKLHTGIDAVVGETVIVEAK